MTETNDEKDYEVVWRVAVSGSSPEDVAAFVEQQFLQPCESGDWIYEVGQPFDPNPTLVVVHDGVGSIVSRRDDLDA